MFASLVVFGLGVLKLALQCTKINDFVEKKSTCISNKQKFFNTQVYGSDLNYQVKKKKESGDLNRDLIMPTRDSGLTNMYSIKGIALLENC